MTYRTNNPNTGTCSTAWNAHAGRFDPDRAADLRRARVRDVSDRLVAMAAALPPEERWIIEAVFLHNRTAVDLAGQAGEDARKMRARIRRLTRRLLTPEFAYTFRHIDLWTKTRQRVARACILHGHSIRAAAARLDLSVHVVRRNLDAVRAMQELDLARQRHSAKLARGAPA